MLDALLSLFRLAWPIIPVGGIGTAIMMWIIRPQLSLHTDKPRCRESVKAGPLLVDAIMLRLYAKNEGIRSTNARCYLMEVRRDGRIVDRERSPLETWIDTDALIQRLGRDESAYINLCQLNADHPNALMLRTAKGRKGYTHQPGRYTFTVLVEGEGMHDACEIDVHIVHDGTLNGLQILSSDARRASLRYGDIKLNPRSLLPMSRRDP